MYYNYEGIKWERALLRSFPLNAFIIVIYISHDLPIVFSYFFMMHAPLEMVAFTTSRIYVMLYLIDIINIDKICD